eukprot:415204-Pleurochrysis_carterae.AAC.1
MAQGSSNFSAGGDVYLEPHIVPVQMHLLQESQHEGRSGEEARASSNTLEPNEDDEIDDDLEECSERSGAGVMKRAWLASEDEKLQQLVDEHGPRRWSTIASQLPGRVGKQCRERWHNHLSPAVNKEEWTEEEDQLIMKLVQEMGTKWSKIVKMLPGRTDNAIKNRWNSTSMRRPFITRAKIIYAFGDALHALAAEESATPAQGGAWMSGSLIRGCPCVSARAGASVSACDSLHERARASAHARAHARAHASACTGPHGSLHPDSPCERACDSVLLSARAS